MQVLFSHPTGNANVRAALKGLLDARKLLEFHTTIAAFPESALGLLGKFSHLNEINRRGYDLCLRTKTKLSPWTEAGRLLASKIGAKYLVRHETGYFSIDAVYRNLDKQVSNRLRKLSNKELFGVYAYEDGAIHSFEIAKQYGQGCFYDLPIGYWRVARELLENEKDKWPEWSNTLTGLKDSSSKLERKDKELVLADKIFVASSFTASTLKSFPGNLAPVEVIPYGFPDVNDSGPASPGNSNGPLKLLFVGGLSQRKGLAELFNAIERFGSHVRLTVVGRKTTEDCSALNNALRTHTYIPSLPHQQILQLMKEHDVLVFPSLFEGFGLVITEAMSQGTPVITTERTAGPDLISHGDNGWLVKAGSTEGLAATIEELLLHPMLIREAGIAAKETARKRPWEVYGHELAKAIQNPSKR